MKNLTDICNESILSDIDTSIQIADNIFKQAEAELNAIKNLTWEDVLDKAKFRTGCVEFKFKFICPNVLKMLGLDHSNADGFIVNFDVGDTYNVYAVMTVKVKNQKDCSRSYVVGSWAVISNYVNVIRPKKLSNAVIQIQNTLNRIADIDTLKNICSQFKRK